MENPLSIVKARHLKDPRIANLAKLLEQNPPQHLQVQGLIGSQLAFLAFALQSQTKSTVVLLCSDKEEAAFLLNDVETVYENSEVLFFPDSFRNPLQFDKLNRTAVLQRTETVSKLITNSLTPQVVVTYPEALFEKVVSPKELKEAAIQIKVGEKLDTNFLVEVLVDYGFQQIDFVYEPGQFSLRGGIVDIYSYGNEHPYRVDMLDDEVESLRTFDPNTQLSLQKIRSVTIVPNVNTQFKASQKTDVFQILPPRTILLIKNAAQVLDRLEIASDALPKYQNGINTLVEQDSEEAFLIAQDSFWNRAEAEQVFQKFATVEFCSEPKIKPSQPPILFKSLPQPSFNKNFEYLNRHLFQNTANNLQNFIFAENPKQIERFSHIFEDMKAAVRWVGIDKPLHEGFADETLGLACYTDHQIFERYHAYKIRQGFDKNKALQLKTLQDLKIGDYVTHIDYGVGKYIGLERIIIQGQPQEAVRILYKDGDLLHVSIHSLHKISKFSEKENQLPVLHKLGSGAWAATKQKTKKKIKELAFNLIELYAKRKSAEGFAFPPDNYLQTELEASFVYEDTPDQAKATEEVKADMEKSYPMDRLICGDVGFGKTEIAIRAAFKAVISGKQVGVLVPTTILALQHANTFAERLKNFGVTVDYVNRFRTTKEKTQIYKRLEEGKIDLLIGTHALLNDKIKFKDLGLLIIDEEQKFGVGAKEKLRNLKVNIDTLTLTATPIPRTLQFSLMAARDLSVINTPPPNRKPIHTEVRTFDVEFIHEVIAKEVNRGGQVFFLHNRVSNLDEMTAMIKAALPNVDIGMAHGQMDATQLEETLLNFIKGYYDVLVCTNIIETGLDISNANTIIINNAHQFGLSDLHQLRGRVGRSNKKAYCYLLAPPLAALTNESKKRLETIEQFSELGSGFQIAMKDLDIRGAGNILGGEQSGFIDNIGYETYQKILAEAIQELKENEYKELFSEEQQTSDYVREVVVETDLEMLLPNSYIDSVEERLSLYQKINKIENETQIQVFKTQLQDRFGAVPKSVEYLFDALRVRWVAKKLGLEKIIYQRNVLKGYFIANAQSPFYDKPIFQQILRYISACKQPVFALKQTNQTLSFICESVKSLSKCLELLHGIEKAVYVE